MTPSIQLIPFAHLSLLLIPVGIVVGLLIKWSLNAGNALYGISRMLAQLLLIGYVLTYIFESKNAWIVLAVLAVMVFVSSWIALRTIPEKRGTLYTRCLVSVFIGGGLVLVLVTQGVLRLEPWYWPRYFIPIAGMIFANAMNSVSLGAERLHAELNRHTPFEKARAIALRAGLIPITNSLFAVGLVSIPGMMTGQILTGISPLIAVRYQIVVMCMVYGASGIATALFITLAKDRIADSAQPDGGKVSP